MARYGRRMDRAWAAQQLREFRSLIDVLDDLASYLESDHPPTEDQAAEYDALVSSYGARGAVVDKLVSLDPIMRDLMEAARPGLGEYAEPPAGGWSYQDSRYWREIVRDRALRPIGIHELGEEAQRRMQPD